MNTGKGMVTGTQNTGTTEGWAVSYERSLDK